MAKLIIEVCKVDAVESHGNADKLEKVQIKGWQCVTPKGAYKPGDLVVYFPPDSLILIEPWATKFGVTKYLSTNTRYPGFGRVKSIKLRGEPSSGLIVLPEDPSWKAGRDVAGFYGVEKYEPPPPKATCGDAAGEHPMFPKYTDIENLRNFPDVIQPGEDVVITEKLHGSNGRIGFVDGEWMAGSHERRRKPPVVARTGFMGILEKLRILSPKKLDDNMDAIKANKYWFPYAMLNLRAMILDLLNMEAAICKMWRAGGYDIPSRVQSVVVYGELVGTQFQGGFSYGLPSGEMGFRVFDILINGRYLDWPSVEEFCRSSGVETVPVLERGPFSIEMVKKHANGKTTMGETNIREGVVVHLAKERHDPKVGRVILKYIGDEYLVMKHGKADKGEEVETKEA